MIDGRRRSSQVLGGVAVRAKLSGVAGATVMLPVVAYLARRDGPGFTSATRPAHSPPSWAD